MMSTCYFYAMHNGFGPPTGGSKFGEHREQQIWEKQSGGLFRSDCATLGIPSSVPKNRRTLLRFTASDYSNEQQPFCRAAACPVTWYTKPPKPVGRIPSCDWNSKNKKSTFGYAVRTGVAFLFFYPLTPGGTSYIIKVGWCARFWQIGAMVG